MRRSRGALCEHAAGEELCLPRLGFPTIGKRLKERLRSCHEVATSDFEIADFFNDLTGAPGPTRTGD